MEIGKSEVLRYMGYKDQLIEKELDLLIDETIEETYALCQARHVRREFPIVKKGNEIDIQGSGLKIKSEDLSARVGGSEKIVIMAATLGNEIEMKIEFYKRMDLLKSIVMDACASVMVESLCDEISKEIESHAKEEGLHSTTRFSPGYGDLELSYQKDILRLLNAYRRIGLSLLKSNILTPRKSVTAFVGLGQEVGQEGGLKCEKCNMKDGCQYRLDKKGGCR